MRILFWLLTLALLISWPELTEALCATALYALQSPPVLVAALVFLGLHRLGLLVQAQAARGWAS